MTREFNNLATSVEGPLVKNLNINELMELTGKSFRTIKSKLSKLTPVHEDGRASYYDSKEALHALFQLSDLAKENLLLERAKREKAEIEVGQLRGELIPVKVIEKVLDKEFSFVRAKMRAIPSKLAKPLSMVNDPHQVFTMLSEGVDECLSELTADATYRLERERIDALQLRSAELNAQGPEADAAAESGGMGGSESVPQS